MEVIHLKLKLKVIDSIFSCLCFIILISSGWRKDRESLYFSAVNHLLLYCGLFIAGILILKVYSMRGPPKYPHSPVCSLHNSALSILELSHIILGKFTLHAYDTKWFFTV